MGPPQSYRSHLLPRYETNYQASLEEDFEERILAELKAFQVLVCRPHCSGEFYSLEYVRKWERIMRKARKTFFYFYSRSWQDSEIAEVFAQMASLRRVRVYFSLDRETGVPPRPHKDIRFAWLKTEPEEVVPDLGPGGLVFRSRKVRGKKKVKEGQALVCPHENGTKNSSQITCQGCQVCLPEPYHSLMRLV